MSDDAFLTAFETGTLPASAWTHEAHVRMAWLYLTRLPYKEAVIRVRTGINYFNNAVLKKDNGYHETITIAFCCLIADARKQLLLPDKSASLDDLKSQFPEFFDRKLSALLRHYRHETLFHESARTSFVEPDLIPLPNISEEHEQSRSHCRK